MNKMNTTSVILGNKRYYGYFVVKGFWVEDAKGNSVAECYSAEVAIALAVQLNKMFEYGYEL